VHEGLAPLLALRWAREVPNTFTWSVNDYGLVLSAQAEAWPDEALLGRMLGVDGVVEDLRASLNLAELARRQFREIARVAGLVFQGYPGQPKSAKQVQATSGLLYEVFARWDAGNPLLAQAEREVLERELEFSRLARAVQRLSAAPVVLRQTGRPTPFAFPLLVARLREKLTSEKLADRVRRMQLEFDRASEESGEDAQAELF
jgi:ATP-dependent Lhr-like helicase